MSVTEEIKNLKLGDITSLSQGLAINSKTKHLLKNKGIPLLRIKDLINNQVEQYVDTENAPRKCLARKSDIIYTRTGQVGLVFNDREGVIHNNCFKVIPDETIVNKKFLYWFLFQKKVRDYAINIASGSVQKDLNHSSFASIPIKLPSLKHQEKAAKIFDTLKRKIELNLKMNETLEEIAKTLFKSWFIDFDPVRAKAEGRPTGLSKEISDLFPDSFEDSELGEIPKGWKAGSLNEIIVRSKEKIKDTNSRVLAAVSSGELVLSEEYFSKQVFSKDISKYIKVEQYDFAYNPSRINIGSIGMNEYDFIGAVSPVYIVFKPLTHWYLFVSQFIRLKSTNSKINQLSSGSVRQSLSFDDFASIPITIPTDDTNMKFNEIYESLRRKIIHNQEECEILTSLRDTLLPKLISGDLKIPDAKNLVEEAGI